MNGGFGLGLIYPCNIAGLFFDEGFFFTYKENLATVMQGSKYIRSMTK